MTPQRFRMLRSFILAADRAVFLVCIGALVFIFMGLRYGWFK